MKQMVRWISSRNFWRDTQGQDLIEYALMAGFLAVLAGTAIPGLTNAIAGLFTRISNTLAGVAPGG